jgi:predicted anti-sigma-YlaC factor YlaD
VTCEQVREAAAVRLLTGGPPDPEVEAHVADCPGCRTELDQLAALPELLAMASTAVEQMQAPSDDAMLERLLSAAAAERHRRRVRAAFVAVAGVAAAALIATPVAIIAANRDQTPVVSVADQVHASASDPSSGVWGKVTIARSSWGSAVNLTVTGVEAGTSCTVVVVTKDGSRQTAATWWAQEYPGPASVEGTVAAGLPTIDRVDLVDTASGRVLLALPVQA